MAKTGLLKKDKKKKEKKKKRYLKGEVGHDERATGPGMMRYGSFSRQGFHIFIQVGVDWQFWLVKVAQLCLTLQLHGLYSPGHSPGQNTEVGSISFLQGIVPTQASSPGLPNCKQILYQLSHNGSPQFWLRVAHYITTDFIVHVFLIIQSAIIRCMHV